MDRRLNALRPVIPQQPAEGRGLAQLFGDDMRIQHPIADPLAEIARRSIKLIVPPASAGAGDVAGFIGQSGASAGHQPPRIIAHISPPPPARLASAGALAQARARGRRLDDRFAGEIQQPVRRFGDLGAFIRPPSVSAFGAHRGEGDELPALAAGIDPRSEPPFDPIGGFDLAGIEQFSPGELLIGRPFEQKMPSAARRLLPNR